MDEINNNGKNPFDEQDMGSSSSAPDQDPYDPYNRPANSPDPYNQPTAPNDPYARQEQPAQNINPYAQQGQYDRPYDQQYRQQGQYMQSADPRYDQQNIYNSRNIPQSGGYVQSPYGTQYRPYMPAQNMSTGMATASMVLGICSIAFSIYMFSFPPLFLVPIIGLILGIAFKCKHLPVGKGASTAGIITSIIGLIIPILLVILMVVILITNGDEVMNFIRQYSPETWQEFYEEYGDQFPEWFSESMKFFGMM